MPTVKDTPENPISTNIQQPQSEAEGQNTNTSSDKAVNCETTTTIATATDTPSETITTLISITNSFLSALSNKSRPEFEKHCLRAAGMALCAPQPAPVRFCTIDSFIDQVTAMRDEIHERGWGHEVKIYEQGNMATVWVPFRAKINGVVDHVGVNLFTLHKLNGIWKITGVADSSRKPTDEERQMD